MKIFYHINQKIPDDYGKGYAREASYLKAFVHFVNSSIEFFLEYNFISAGSCRTRKNSGTLCRSGGWRHGPGMRMLVRLQRSSTHRLPSVALQQGASTPLCFIFGGSFGRGDEQGVDELL